MKIKKSTIVRSILLGVALINQILTIKGKSVLPFTDEQVESAVSTGFTAITAVWAWWKNNSFTAKAIEADKYKAEELSDE